MRLLGEGTLRSIAMHMHGLGYAFSSLAPRRRRFGFHSNVRRCEVVNLTSTAAVTVVCPVSIRMLYILGAMEAAICQHANKGGQEEYARLNTEDGER